MKSKKYLMIIVLVVAMLLLGANSSHAVLQANGGTMVQKNIYNWLIEIRQMESLGGTLGLTETINTTTLLPTSTSNNLDIHLQKNTEYGAIAILSASSYGNPNVIGNKQTTTGNKTGIVIENETVTNSWGDVVATNFYKYQIGSWNITSVNSKYVNNYTDRKEKKGDATIQTAGWHNGGSSSFSNIGNSSTMVMCRRQGSTSVFDFYIGAEANYGNYARAIMICGEGI